MQSTCSVFAVWILAGVLVAPVAGWQEDAAPGEATPSAEQADGEDDILTIGSRAPELDIEHWLTDNTGLFVHTTRFEQGVVYVIDFWSPEIPVTIRAMPILAKLQGKYNDGRLQVISVGSVSRADAENFLETNYPGGGDDGPETFRDLVEGYCLTADPDMSVFNEYLRAAKRTTVPCSFIVSQDGEIEWIGNTLEIEEPLTKIMEGKWDRKKFAASYQKEMETMLAEAAASRDVASILRDLRGKMVNGPDEGLEFLQTEIGKAENPLVKRQLAELRLQLIIGLRKESAPAELRTFADTYTDESNAGNLNDLVWGVYERHEALGDVSPKLLKACRYAAEIAVKFDPESGAVNDTVAHFVYLDGDLDKAIEWQKKAVANAEGREADLQPFLDALLKEKETGVKALDFARPEKKKADF